MIGFKEFMEVHEGINSIAIISAQNPNGIKIDDEINYRLNAQLNKELTDLGCDTKEFIGHFAGNDENTFLVVNIKKIDLLSLALKYGQRAVIWGQRANNKYIFDYIENGKTIKKSSVPYDPTITSAQDLFEALKKGQFKLPIF